MKQVVVEGITLKMPEPGIDFELKGPEWHYYAGKQRVRNDFNRAKRLIIAKTLNTVMEHRAGNLISADICQVLDEDGEDTLFSLLVFYESDFPLAEPPLPPSIEDFCRDSHLEYLNKIEVSLFDVLQFIPKLPTT